MNFTCYKIANYVPKYIRYRSGSETRYGILEDGAVRELHGDLFDHEPTGSTHALKAWFCSPPIAAEDSRRRPQLRQPSGGEARAIESGNFLQAQVSCLQDPGAPIVIAARCDQCPFRRRTGHRDRQDD